MATPISWRNPLLAAAPPLMCRKHIYLSKLGDDLFRFGLFLGIS
jgi:hypothetical protein